MQGHAEVVQLLLEAGSRIDAKDQVGFRVGLSVEGNGRMSFMSRLCRLGEAC